MKTITLSQASRPLSEHAAELNDEVVVITDRGKSVAAIVPLKTMDQESVALSNHPEFLRSSRGLDERFNRDDRCLLTQ